REVALKLKDAARYPFSSNATRSELSAGPAGGFPPRTPTRGPLLGGPPAPVTRKRLTLGGNAEKAIPSKASRFEPLVIVVDTTRDAGRFPAYIGNVYNFDVTPLQKKFAKDIFFMPGLFEETEDETWVYGHEKGLPTFYFGIPISHHKDYHDTDNAITLKQIQRSGKVLISLIKNIEK
ncbi:hypothetical protein HY031_00825, partial [Candidatus Gottesmanbacteria bacterium]|nr:hypothetical protein [Candidatus Gottesmanbacteria bacterium]